MGTSRLALEGDDYLAPYFGTRYRRHVSLVPATRAVPADVAWVVAASSMDLDPCAWAVSRLASGWHIYRRTHASCREP